MVGNQQPSLSRALLPIFVAVSFGSFSYYRLLIFDLSWLGHVWPPSGNRMSTWRLPVIVMTLVGHWRTAVSDRGLMDSKTILRIGSIQSCFTRACTLAVKSQCHEMAKKTVLAKWQGVTTG
jgi:hypothetical protein